MKKSKIFKCTFFIAFSVLISLALAQKIDQRIDLGALSVEGEIVTPSDLTIDIETEEGAMILFKRTHYRDRVNMNLQSVF
jgi:hypothetical protein